jgi:transposase
VLLGQGMGCGQVAKALLLDDDTVRTWHRLHEEDGIEGLATFGCEGSACRLSDEQQDKLHAWATGILPRTTCHVGAWIEREFGVPYESRSGLIAPLHRLGMEHRLPKAVSRKLGPAKQAAFVKAHEPLLNGLGADGTVVFAGAVHPTPAVRPVGCWAPKDAPAAVAQTSGRQRSNVHGAIELETGTTSMIEAETIDAASTIRLMVALLALYPRKRVIHLFLDNARHHHARLVQQWLAQQGGRTKLHFIPACCPRLDPIERLVGADAQVRHPQPMPWDICRLPGRDPGVPARGGAQKLARVLRCRNG